VRSSSRSRADDDVIRARLRVLLAEGERSRGWVPEDDRDDRGWSDADEDPAWDDEVQPADRPIDDDVALPGGLGRHRAPGRTARLDPGRPGAWALWAVALLAAATVIGWTWLHRPAVDTVDQVEQVTAAPTTPPAATSSSGPAGTDGGTVVVSVVGQVGAPGLVTLPAGARVADALAAAGGLLPGADATVVNAAALLSDGQQVAVGVPGAAPPTGSDPGSGAADAGPVDLNTATVADLDALPGIGPVLAQRIVDHRTAHGPFTSVEELDDVSGIGPAIFADLAERVRV